MGVNLRELFPAHPVPADWYQGKRIAVDGHNVAFRYLTSFRDRQGDMLRAADGRPIGHLVGYANLVRHLRERGAEPIVVWDGAVHERKQRTVSERIAVRRGAETNASNLAEALSAVKASGFAEAGHAAQALAQQLLAIPAEDPNRPGEPERARLAGLLMLPPEQAGAKEMVRLEAELVEARRRVSSLTPSMVEDCSRMLEALGVAVVRAEHDGERHAAGLCHAGFADAVATEDFDALVAGAPVVIRKAGSQEPFMHHLADLAGHGLTVAQLRQVAILCGTDWHPGVRGFGARTAVKAVQSHDDLRELWQPGSSRFHALVKRNQTEPDALTLQDFEELDAYIAHIPQPKEAPRRPRPSPEMAHEVALEMGLDPARVKAAL